MALAIPNRFTNGQTIDAAKFNSNFDAISTWAGTTDSDITAAETTIATHTSQITTLQTVVAKGSFFAYNSTSQTLGSATTYIDIDLDDTGAGAFDTASYFTIGTGAYVPTVAGAYIFNVNIPLSETGLDSGESVKIFLAKNGTERYEILTLHDSYAHGGGASLVLKANGTTDSFTLQAYVSAGVNTVITRAFFSGCMVEAD